MSLESLTKEQLIQALKLYQADVQDLKSQVSMLSDSNTQLVEIINTTKDSSSAYESMYFRMKEENKKLKTTNDNLVNDIKHLEFEVKKQRSLATTACLQAQEAKRKSRTTTFNSVNIFAKFTKDTDIVDDIQVSATVDFDINGFYSPRKR